MPRNEVGSLVESVVQPVSEMIDMAARLSNEDLDALVPHYGGREASLRSILYGMTNHAVEHAVQLNKIADEIGKGHPTEAQRIAATASEAVGALWAALARFEDADVDTKDHEDQSVRAVLDHVAVAMKTNASRVTGYLEGGGSSN